MKIKNTLIAVVSSLVFGGASIGMGMLAYTNANVDQLDLLTRAVKDDKVKELKLARGDIKIEAGENHAGAIIGNKLYMWGRNDWGQLGIGSTGGFAWVPTRINIPNGTITELAMGVWHSGIIIDNSVYTWGRNDYGQLGLGHTTSRVHSPQFVLGGANSLAFGQFHSGAIVNGTIYMWGRNDWGQVGDDSYVTRTRPTIVYDKNIKGMYARELSLGFKHSGAILTNPKNGNRRELYAWGLNTNAELGYSTGAYEHWEYPDAVKDINKLSGTLQSISFGGTNSSAIVSGTLYTWGDNGNGQLGIGTVTRWEWVSRVTTISNVTSVKVAKLMQEATADIPGHMLAINSSGSLYAWGKNYNGQIGNGGTTNVSTPQLIRSSNVSAISAAGYASFAIIGGQLYSWGYGKYDVLGNGGNNSDVLTPTMINIRENYTINLNSSNDPYNKRNDVVYNVIKNSNDIKNIVEASSNQMNLPRSYNLSNVQAIGSTQDNTGRMTTTVDGAFPIITDITINGFLPVKETALTKISPKEVMITDDTFKHISTVDLVNEANADNTGTNSKLARWIINNSAMIIGNLPTYTQDFPELARIVKADGFVSKSWSKGEIEFNIYVDKYYEKSGNNIIISSSNTPVRLTTKISLSGLPKVISYQDCIDGRGKIQIIETQIEPQTSADKFFMAITGNINGGLVTNRVLLGEYINIRFIPGNATVSIVRDPSVVPTPGVVAEPVAFTLTTDKYYWLGSLIEAPNPPLTEYISFVILPKVSSISVKDNIEDVTSQITTGDALQLLKSQNNIQTESSKYLSFKNFPSSTFFSLGDLITNDNESGILNISVNANKYYDLDKLDFYSKNKEFTNLEIAGFKPSYDMSKYPVNTSNEKIETTKSKTQFFDEVIQNNVVNRSFIEQYLDLRSIPENAKLSIPRMEYNNDDTIWLTVRTDRYYDDGGVTIIEDFETTILIQLPTFDVIWIIILASSILFLLFLITCIIISVKNKNRIKDEIIE